MTRFARAKGSKSSNERVPDEATPWNVMKMQLEDSQASSKDVTKKPKNAKQLLAEKDEPFYYDTTGNVNHEWAAFDDLPESKSGKNKEGKPLKNKNSKKDKKDKKKIEIAAKLHLSNGDSSKDQIVEVVEKGKNVNKNEEVQVSTTVVTKKKKKTINSGTESKSEKHVNPENKNDPSVDLNSKETPSDDKSDLKSKKRAKKAKKLKAIVDSGETDNRLGDVQSGLQESQKDQLADADCDEKGEVVPKVGDNFEKLSKRQKRNQKKQRKIISDKNEMEIDEIKKDAVVESSQKEEGSKGFDVLGNDWSNEVKFGKQTNLHRLSANAISNTDSEIDKSNNVDKRKEKLNKKKRNLEEGSLDDKAENDNSISDNSKTQNEPTTQNKKDQKRKKGSKNDNKEYKRRKPDEGVVKMIINGNEIEVVKYDGFPVKKEDADRLQELKKNMIIKGIPRSEINVAMKLERRKAEKALARERKRVCFHCRKSGHNLSDCPELGRDEAGSGICFKCGSAEHTHFECKVIKGQEFRHASCFICREQGHIARQCPDNPKGLYPQGGGCKICGDVTHLKKDCPDLIKEKEETNITADKIVSSQLESLQEDEAVLKNENNSNKPRNKIIKF